MTTDLHHRAALSQAQKFSLETSLPSHYKHVRDDLPCLVGEPVDALVPVTLKNGTAGVTDILNIDGVGSLLILTVDPVWQGHSAPFIVATCRRTKKSDTEDKTN